MGHEIAPGASYCAQGHPIALEQMQFANDPYAAAGGYAPQPGFGAPPPPAPAYGAPPAAPAFAAPPPGYGASPQPGFGAPPPVPAFGAPPPAPAPAFSSPAQPAYGQPAPASAFGPPQAQGFGVPPNDTARDAVPPKIVRGFLVAYGTNPAGDFWPLTGGRLTVGRLGSAEGIDISLQDPTISSRHAALLIDGPSGAVTIEDTGSTNGTFVNDEHIGFNGRRELRDGDRIRFGGFTTVVKVIGRV
jgi:hypothetical protein